MSEQVAVAEETNAQPAAVEKRTEEADLDSLLAEFDQGTKKPEPAPQPEPKQPEISSADIEMVKQVRDRLFQDEVSGVCKELFDGLNVPKRGQVGWLDQIAREKPAIVTAFQNKGRDPASWNKISKMLKAEVAKDFAPSKVDEEATVDHAAVAHAVRGASTKVAAEPAPDFGKMSDAEFQKWKMENMK